MALSAFADAGAQPNRADLKKILGKAAPLWTAFVDGVEQQAGTLRQRWNFSGATFGWSLRLMKGERILTYVTPQQGRFLVGLVLGKKVTQPDSVKRLSVAAAKLIENAPQYAEGRGLRMEVASRAALRTALEIAALKTKS
jgi:hypothetical protein